MVRFGAAAACIALMVACAGRSLDGEGGSAGVGGASSGGGGGSIGGGSGGTGGMATGGTGGMVTGGTGGMVTGGTGGMPIGTGGASTGGVGGMLPTGGTGGTGTAGVAGAGSICALPLVVGSCHALFYAYGFDPAVGHCVSFVYGGCDGNENRFETLAACEAACGGSSEGACPATQPFPGDACDSSDEPCYYGAMDGCLCVPGAGRLCSKVDPQCPRVLLKLPPPEEGAECIGDECVSDLIVLSRMRCQCTSGTWGCVGEA